MTLSANRTLYRQSRTLKATLLLLWFPIAFCCLALSIDVRPEAEVNCFDDPLLLQVSKELQSELALDDQQQNGTRKAWGAAENEPSASLLKEVCVEPNSLKSYLDDVTKRFVSEGLPAWSIVNDIAPANKDEIKLAFLTQLSFTEKLSTVSRVFSHIYHANDIFMYLVDSDLLTLEQVHAVLPSPLPRNVFVNSSMHASYFYWPRVQILLDGLHALLQYKWDFVVHLSESDYPVHQMKWIRGSLAAQRRTNFIHVEPRCATSEGGNVIVKDWYWWRPEVSGAVASCGPCSHAVAACVEPSVSQEVEFPMQTIEQHGFAFAKSTEWMILTRELVQYATSAALSDYRRLISTRAAADEIFWATMISNIPNFTQALSPQGWYIEFDDNAGHSPETLTTVHEQQIWLQRERYFFIRKVDEQSSAELLRHLDTNQGTSQDTLGIDFTMQTSLNAVPCPELGSPQTEPVVSSPVVQEGPSATPFIEDSIESSSSFW